MKKERQSLPMAFRQQIWERDNNQCFYCGIPVNADGQRKDGATIDHKTPTSKGGSDDPANLITACRICNTTKGSLTLEQYRVYVQRKRSPAARARKLLKYALSDLRATYLLGTPIDQQLLEAIEWCDAQVEPVKFWGEISSEMDAELNPAKSNNG